MFALNPMHMQIKKKKKVNHAYITFQKHKMFSFSSKDQHSERLDEANRNRHQNVFAFNAIRIKRKFEEGEKAQ